MASASTVMVVIMFASAVAVVIATVATATTVTTSATAALTAQAIDEALYLILCGLTALDNLARETEGLA